MSDYTQPRYVGLDDVMEAFERKAKTPYWSLWDKNQCIEQCNIDDESESINMLISEINQSIKHNNSRPLSLLLHPEKESFYDKRKSKAYANIYFVAVQPQSYGNVGSMGNNQLLPIQQQLNAMQSQLNALQNVNEDEDDDDDESETMGALNGINKLLEHPLVNGLISKLLMNDGTPVQTLSGIETSENEIADCINILFSKGVTIEHLKKLANMDESKIKMLLTML